MKRIVFCALILLLSSGSLMARSNYRGYSGAPGSLGTCASSCHGSGGGTVQISGFPTEYVPDSTYLITITAVSGSSINNFNGSVRVGTGSTNAGTISAGTNTATHNVAGETNGIHLSSNNRTSGNFNWLAPAAGTGTVHLYVGAHQGTNMSGANTSIVQVAEEVHIPQLPGEPSCVAPLNAATDTPINTQLLWSVAANADFYNVYFGEGDPPTFVMDSVNSTSYGVSNLTPGTTYFWQIVAVNEDGSTPSEIWHFTTTELPEQVEQGTPLDGAQNVPVTTGLSWSAAVGANDYLVFWGVTEPLELIVTTPSISLSFVELLEYNTTYLWRIDASNSAGTTTGTVWTFTTEAANPAHDELVASEFSLSQAYPNPFNSSVRINLNIPTESEVTVSIFDQTGRLVSTLLDNSRVNGNVELAWNATGHSAGVYFLRCECAGISLARKLVYLP